MAHVYCPECGYNNPESAHFCAKCGAALVVPGEGESTEAFTAPEVPDLDPLEDLGLHGAALIVRSGGGRSGETFPLDASPTTIGRSPECAIFLDDVTVSRKHAVFTKEDGDRWRLEDQGSLNGTFVNRERVETAELSDGDELQIGKYRLTFLQS
jgi:hypothetical protein